MGYVHQIWTAGTPLQKVTLTRPNISSYGLSVVTLLSARADFRFRIWVHCAFFLKMWWCNYYGVIKCLYLQLWMDCSQHIRVAGTHIEEESIEFPPRVLVTWSHNFDKSLYLQLCIGYYHQIWRRTTPLGEESLNPKSGFLV